MLTHRSTIALVKDSGTIQVKNKRSVGDLETRKNNAQTKFTRKQHTYMCASHKTRLDLESFFLFFLLIRKNTN